MSEVFPIDKFMVANIFLLLLPSWADHLAARPAFMYDMAQTILACSSVKEFGQRRM